MPVLPIQSHKVDLKQFSHIRIGSECSCFYEPETREELCLIIQQLKAKKQRFIPLAGGSNLLFGNTGRIPLISINRLPSFWEKDTNNIIRVSANYNITRFIMEMAKINLGGLEFLAGIPALLAGLAKMNAGAWGKEFSTFISEITVIDSDGQIRELKARELDFSYRQSSIKGFITELKLNLKSLPEKSILKLVKEKILLRSQKQPLNLPNLGSIFKNPPGDYAGRLLQAAGLKGKRIGDAAFWERHANIMVNKGNASFSDAASLIKEAQEAVTNKFGLELELEIEVIDQ